MLEYWVMLYSHSLENIARTNVHKWNTPSVIITTFKANQLKMQSIPTRAGNHDLINGPFTRGEMLFETCMHDLRHLNNWLLNQKHATKPNPIFIKHIYKYCNINTIHTRKETSIIVLKVTTNFFQFLPNFIKIQVYIQEQNPKLCKNYCY